MSSQTDYFKNISFHKKIRVLRSKFSRNTKLMGCLPEDVFIEYLTGSGAYFEIDENVLKEVELEYKKRSESDKILKTIADLNNKGIAFEKSGEIKKAIGEYEKCLQWMYDHFDGGLGYIKQIAWHSPNRLRILYKKTKSWKERDFLEDFISFCEQNSIEVPEVFKNQFAKLQ